MYSPTDSKHIRICTSDNYIDNICRNIETSVPSSFIHHIFGINEPNGFQTQSKYCVNKTRRQHHFYKLIFDYFSTTHRHTHTHFIDSRGLFQVFFFTFLTLMLILMSSLFYSFRQHTHVRSIYVEDLRRIDNEIQTKHVVVDVDDGVTAVCTCAIRVFSPKTHRQF